MNNEKEGLEQQIKENNEKREAKEQELDNKLSDLQTNLSNQISNLSEQLKTATAEVKEDLEKKMDILAGLQEEIDKQITTRLDNQQKQIEDLQTKQVELENKLESVQKQLETASNDQKEALEQQKNNLQEQINENKARQDKINKQLGNGLNLLRERLNEQKTYLEKQLEKAATKEDQAQIQNKINDLKTKQEEVNTKIKKRLNNHEARIGILEGRIEVLEEQNKKQNKKVDTLKNKLKREREKRKKQNERLEKLEYELEQIKNFLSIKSLSKDLESNINKNEISNEKDTTKKARFETPQPNIQSDPNTPLKPGQPDRSDRKKQKINFGTSQPNKSEKYFDLKSSLVELNNLYVDFAFAKKDPQNVYLHNDLNIRTKQKELTEKLVNFNGDDENIANLVNTLQEFTENGEEDFKNLLNAINDKNETEIYDSLSQICMDSARAKTTNKSVLVEEKHNEEIESFDKGFEEHARETLEDLSENCKVNRNDFKKKTGVDYSEFPEVINNIERSRIVAEIAINNDKNNKVKSCADIAKGKVWSEVSDEYKECINNYDNSIQFDGIEDDYDDEGNRTIVFIKGNDKFSITLDEEQAEKFDMLELGKHVGKDIGLFAGLTSYLSSHKEIGINENNINDILSIYQRSKKISNSKEKNQIILKTFSGPNFNEALSAAKAGAKIGGLATTCMQNTVTNEAYKQKAGIMTLACLGQEVQNLDDIVSNSLISQVKSLKKDGLQIR